MKLATGRIKSRPKAFSYVLINAENIRGDNELQKAFCNKAKKNPNYLMDTCVNNNGEISSWRSNWQLKDGLLRAHFEFILAALLVHFMSKK